MRPKTILDNERMERFYRAVELGATIKACCDAIGMSEAWFFSMQAKAKADLEAGLTDTDEIKFLEGFKKASAKFEEDNLEVIRQASRKGSWQASAWLLERRRPADYSAKVDVGGTGENLIIKTSVPRKGKQDGDA